MDNEWFTKITARIEENLPEITAALEWDKKGHGLENRFLIRGLFLIGVLVGGFALSVGMFPWASEEYGQLGDFVAVAGVLLAIYGLILVIREMRQNSQLALLNTYLQVSQRQVEMEFAEKRWEAEEKYMKAQGNMYIGRGGR